MPSFPRRSSRKNSKNDKPTTQTAVKSRPGLAVDTSFSRHHGKAPEQVFPQQANPQEIRFIRLMDLQSIRENSTPKPISKQVETEQHLNGSVYVATSQQQPTHALGIRQGPDPVPLKGSQHTLAPSTSLVHKRIKGLRPTPLELGSEVSPSDRAIPIGIEVSTSSLTAARENRTHNRLSVRGHEPQQMGKELPTPTIVITPAREDFHGPFTTSPEENFVRSDLRPTSSVYSAHTNNTASGNTPPVPPLPLFAAQSNASLGHTTLDLSRNDTQENGSRSRSGLSLQTMFEEQNLTETKASLMRSSRRLTAGSSTSRRSKGWWNVITSPFSPSGMYPGYFLRSPSADDGQGEETEPIILDASKMARSKLPDIIFRSRDLDDDELRSAPGASTNGCYDHTPRVMPQRSDTAPGALDKGSSGNLNIYRQPSKGAAPSYYDLRSPDAARPKSFTAERGLIDEDWSPSQSVYRASKPFVGIRDSEFYGTPGTGEAAAYYDSNKRFPSLAPDELIDKDIAWDPRDSVARPQEEGKDSRNDLSESSRSTHRSDAFGPPYPANTDPFNDSHAAKYDDLGQGGPRGYVADLTPSSGDVSAFKDFSATHPAASYPDIPEISCHNPSPEAVQRNGSEDALSPLETPLVEEARTATLMGPETHREVEVASAKLKKTPPAYGASLGNATMASRDASEGGYARSIDSMTDDLGAYWDQESRPTDEGGDFGYLAQERGRGVNRFSQDFSEKPMTRRADLDRADDQGQEAKTPWYRRFARLLIAITVVLFLGLLALLLVLLVPWNHGDPPVEAAWLNLTGFPPLPTGVATVINPKTVQQIEGCTSKQGLWSCGLPASDGAGTSSGIKDSPDFRFQIRFRDDILPSNETAIRPSNITLSRRSLGHVSGARSIARRDIFTSPLWISSPAIPSQPDQDFLGQTTDNNSAPYDGERTPFYITLLNATAITGDQTSGLQKRDFHYPYPTAHSSASNSSSNSSNFSSPHDGGSTSPELDPSIPDIPYAATTNGGYPAPAELYPFAYAQPLRLYDRGLSSEHYGFYTYFDRTLYISDAANITQSGGNSSVTSILTSNTPLDSSTAVCTWSQTRLLVEIWTHKADVTSLNATANSEILTVESTANDMTAPGSFPYSVTVTLDRHGGDAGKKGVYCHSLDGEHRVLQDVRTWVIENRSFGGLLVNPAPVPTNEGTMISKRDGNQDGIDGGTGGCTCKWQNW